MKNKPLFFTIISILCFIEPLIKILYFKAITHFDFVVILANLKSRNTFLEVFDFWLVFPMAGILILKLRKWTYFAFLGILIYINYNIFTYEKYTWPYNSDTPFMYNYVITFLSLLVFAYFLLPKTRQPFFDGRVRWWEPMTRYNVQMSCKLHSKNLVFPTQILNISRTGAFLLDSRYLNVGDHLELEFTYKDMQLLIPVEVINKHTVRNQLGFGVKFHFKNFGQSLKMSKFIAVLKRSNAEARGEKITA